MLSASDIGLMPDPYHCPDCHATLVDIDGVGGCPRCGFSAADPRATRIWQIDTQIAGLAHERAGLLELMRHERAGAPPTALEPAPATPPVPAPRPHRVRRAMSVQAVLVTVGAVLLVVAGIVFAAVTWERLGAAGQAGVLAVVTATAATATLLTARRRLVATAEALSVVTAGFALVDVHAARVALAPTGTWQPVWAVGLAVVAAGLVALGRVGHLRVPAVLGAAVAQAPLVVLATMAAAPVPAALGALVVVAAVDHLVAHRLEGSPWAWLPDPTRIALLVLGVTAWVSGALFAIPWALGGATPDITTIEQWWGVAVLVVATAEAVLLALTGGVRRPLGVAASAAAMPVGMFASVAVVLLAGLSEFGLQVFLTAVPAMVLGASLPALRREAAARDLRLRAAQVSAGVLSAFTILSWAGPVIFSVVAPLVSLADHGWWAHGAGATTGSLGITRNLGDADAGGLAWLAVLAAVVIGTASLLAAFLAVFRPSDALRRAGMPVITGTGCFLAVAVIAAGWSVPVAAVVAVYLLATAALVLVPVWPGRPWRPLVAIATLPVAVSAVAWAGSVPALTVAALLALTLVAGAATARGLAGEHRGWATTFTAITGLALPATALTLSLAVGSSTPTAWLVATATASAASAVAWYADRRAPWWSLAVDITSVTLVAVTLVGTAIAGGADALSIGLAVVAVVAAAHVLRPSRRWVATGIASATALVLLWLRLWEGGVRAVEAFTLPAAALLLLAGWRLMVRHRALGSWPALGPGLLVAAAPSVVVAVMQEGVVRPLVLLGVAVMVTVLGAVYRLQAPLLVGAATAVIVAVDQVFPVVAQLPRWLSIGTAGVLLIVLGATFEHRRKQTVDAYHRYRELR